ncbi:hypothetical protein AHF37_11917 [Paragonimus kellicotti]|nr:hypothetical protein AHF37_11917 [Paragonimus kellicotti]
MLAIINRKVCSCICSCRPPSMKNWIECTSCGLHVQASDAVGTASCSIEPVRICLDSETRPELSIPCSTCISFAAQVGQKLAQSCPSRCSDVVTEPLSTPISRPPSMKNWIECTSCGLHVQASDAVGTASCSIEPVRICLDSETRPELSIPCSTCISFAAQVGQKLAQSCPSRCSDVVTEPLSTPISRLVSCNQVDHFVLNRMCFCFPDVAVVYCDCAHIPDSFAHCWLDWRV